MFRVIFHRDSTFSFEHHASSSQVGSPVPLVG